MSTVAERYFAAVRARDIDAFMALFAEGATFALPDGRLVSGLAAIREMELHAFTHGAPTPWPAATVVGDNSIAVEIDVTLPDGSKSRVADFFHLDDEGLIRSVSVYRQG